MTMKEKLEKIISHLEADLNVRLLAFGLQPVTAWGCYRVDDSRGEKQCVGTVSLWGSNIDEDQRSGSVTIEIRLPSGQDNKMDDYQDCLIASLDAGGHFGGAFLETWVSSEEKWPSGPQVHGAVMAELTVRMDRMESKE